MTLLEKGMSSLFASSRSKNIGPTRSREQIKTPYFHYVGAVHDVRDNLAAKKNYSKLGR
jgi:hypothetical protein